jgi:hypothetical protein
MAVSLLEIVAGPDVWIWYLDQDVPYVGSVEVENSSGLPWTEPGAWTTSSPEGWGFVGNESLLRWEVFAPGFEYSPGLFATGIGDHGAFAATPANGGSQNENGSWGINGPPNQGPIGAPVVPIPEASSLALMALGLCAGAFWKWRKK